MYGRAHGTVPVGCRLGRPGSRVPPQPSTGGPAVRWTGRLLLPLSAVSSVLATSGLIAGCGDAVPTEVVLGEAPSLMAESRLAADTVVVTVTATNEGDLSIRYVRRAFCALWIRISADASRSTVAWDEEAWLNATRAVGCKAPTVERVLAPGATETLGEAVAVSDVLGDSLPAGVYHLTAAVVIGDPGLSIVDVPAGSLDLSRP